MRESVVIAVEDGMASTRSTEDIRVERLDVDAGAASSVTAAWPRHSSGADIARKGCGA